MSNAYKYVSETTSIIGPVLNISITKCLKNIFSFIILSNKQGFYLRKLKMFKNHVDRRY